MAPTPCSKLWADVQATSATLSLAGSGAENGPKGTAGPISKAWNVRGWPTVYVIDHKGVVRYKGPREKSLDEAVDTLLAELHKEAARGQ